MAADSCRQGSTAARDGRLPGEDADAIRTNMSREHLALRASLHVTWRQPRSLRLISFVFALPHMSVVVGFPPAHLGSLSSNLLPASRH